MESSLLNKICKKTQDLATPGIVKKESYLPACSLTKHGVRVHFPDTEKC